MQDKLSILIVDDDAVDRMAVRRALRAAHLPCAIEEATDSDSALASIASTHFDVVLLDYRLPGTDGLAVLRNMRERGLVTPVVMLTGQGDEQLAVELLRAGATDYLTKDTLSPDVLAQSIHRAQRIHRAEQLAAQAEQAVHIATDRQRWLAQASQYLVETLDLQVTLDRLVELGLRKLADGCAVDMLADDGTVARVAAATRDQRAALPNSDQPADAALIRSGQAQRYATVDAELVARQPFLLPFTASAVCSAMIVPLAVRGVTTGAITFVSTAANRVYNDDDQRLAEDLVHRAAIALENARLYHAAQEAIHIRDVFLSVAAHELKTPLTTLFGNAQLVQRRAERENLLQERDQRSLRIIVEQSARLNRMITALLDLSRLQMGQLTIQTAPLDLVALTERVVDELQPSLDRHTIALLGVDVPILISGDELRLDQVLQNLIQNAIKYSPSGGTITVQLDQTPVSAQVAVIDQGIGIPETAIPNLFRRFYRAPNVQEHRISGIGVGLYVVSEIVALHGGTITVESTEDIGTTFTVTLPLHAVAEAVG